MHSNGQDRVYARSASRGHLSELFMRIHRVRVDRFWPQSLRHVDFGFASTFRHESISAVLGCSEKNAAANFIVILCPLKDENI
jgi:hypothetical protein